MVSAGTFAVASPAAAEEAYGACPSRYFVDDTQLWWYLTELRRGIPPNENNRYIYGEYNNPRNSSVQKRLCGPA